MNSVAHMEKKIKRFVEYLPLIEIEQQAVFEKNFSELLNHINESSLAFPEKRRELMKYCYNVIPEEMNKSVLQRHVRTKPMGYPGDYLIIDWLYTRKADSPGNGRLWDEFFQKQAAAKAVRNRRDFFCARFEELRRQGRKGLTVLNIASGPCRDIADALAGIDGNEDIFIHCADSDPRAIAYAKGVVNGGVPRATFQWEAANAFLIRPPRMYNLVWSAGFFDYIEDRPAAALLRRMWKWTSEGGTLIIGNFHPRNPSRNYMEWLGERFLIYRTEYQLFRLCDEAGIPGQCVSIEQEPLGVNLFIIATKR